MVGQKPVIVNKQEFLICNPQLDQQKQPIDVAEVRIDTQTCDPKLLEQFLNHLFIHPPERGFQAVKVLYQGRLVELGEHVKNMLRKNFPNIKKQALALRTKQT